MAPRHGLSLGYGMHHQTQPLPVFFFRERDDDGNVLATNDDLGFTRNQHLVLAYQYKPSADWRLKAEAYMQWLSNVPVDNYPSSFSILNAGADFVFPDRGSLVNEGVGTNRGLELTAEKNFSRGYYGLVTLSLFEARYEGSDGIERSTAFDGGYVFNFLAGKEFQLGNTVRRCPATVEFLTNLDSGTVYYGFRHRCGTDELCHKCHRFIPTLGDESIIRSWSVDIDFQSSRSESHARILRLVRPSERYRR
jgi:hypothetical protein